MPDTPEYLQLSQEGPACGLGASQSVRTHLVWPFPSLTQKVALYVVGAMGEILSDGPEFPILHFLFTCGII